MWFVFAISFALITSVTGIILKQIMKEVDEYLALLVSGILALPTLFAIVLIFYQVPVFDGVFVEAVVASTGVSVIAAVLAYRAIKISEISLVNPISAFNPVFTAFVAYVTLGESIGIRGVLGIALVVLGAYLLNVSKIKKGSLLAPLMALVEHRGVQLSFVAYFLWAITPVFQKTAIGHTYPTVPAFASMAGMLGSVVIYFPLTLAKSKKPVYFVKKYLRQFLLVGLLGGVGQALAFAAFGLVDLGVATAVFKVSMVFTVILGWAFFKEKNIKDRLLGSLVMLGGVILLVV
jgi:drug/metabolite transporter (DMT)-like permease